MNQHQLHKPDRTPVNLWQCQCGNVFSSEDCAERCCICTYCGEPIGKDDFYHRRSCPIHVYCHSERRQKIDAKRMEEAEKLESWDGWVYCEDVGYNHGYFSSVDEFEEYWENEIGPLEDIPEFVFVCKTVPVVENGDSLFCDIIGNIVDNGWEDMQESDLHGLEEFFAACKAFSEANKGVVSCQENYKQAVRVRQTREN